MLGSNTHSGTGRRTFEQAASTTVGYEFELLNEDGTRERFEGFETVNADQYRACDVVEGWYRDTYGDLAYWNAWIEPQAF